MREVFGRLPALHLFEHEFQKECPVDFSRSDVLFVSYAAPAELGSFLQIGWSIPRNILDLWAEARMNTNYIGKRSRVNLLTTLAHYGIDSMDYVEKEEMRSLIMNQTSYTPEEQKQILEYCDKDVLAIIELLPFMLQEIPGLVDAIKTVDRKTGWVQALFRGRYQVAITRIDREGVPIDVGMHDRLMTVRPQIRQRLIDETNAKYDVYTGDTFTLAKFTAFLNRHNIWWPQTRTGLPKTDEDTFDSMRHTYPELNDLYHARKSIKELNASTLSIFADGCSRAFLNPFASATGSNQPAKYGYKGRFILQEPLQEGLHLATMIAKLAESLREQRPEYMEEPENSLYDKLLTRTDNLSEDIRKVFSVDQRDTYVYYVERETKPGRRGSNLEVNATPLDVNSLLRELLFNESKVICTSATLATVGPNPVDPEDRRPNFAYFRNRVGLDHTEYSDVLEHILPYTFDYENNALLYLPRHLPEPVYGPDSNNYTNKIAEEMMRLVEASWGRAFLLFSSKRMLYAVYNIFLDSLPTYLDFRMLRQGDMNRIELVREFRESESAILFGLKSFWEGVDIAGESLSLVVIDKLPFDPPDDPVHEARVAKMKANKENWFGNYVLPQAVLRLKQGLGRLLRTQEDRGVMAILDTRLYTKSYGNLVINDITPARRPENFKYDTTVVTRFIKIY
jgi:hypothetical protein